jgi:glycosyltransferase involved in cell wall biosynthesis
VVKGSGGGPDKTILNSPRFLLGSGYHTLCAYMHPPGDPGFEQLRARAELWQAPLLSVPDRGPWDWGVFTKLLGVCRRERVALWHGHDYKSNALGLLVRRFWRMRLLTTVHGWVHQTARTPLYYWIDRKCLSRYDGVICVSEDLRQRCLACGVQPERCFLIENGIDTEEYSRRLSVAEARRRIGAQEGRQLIGAAGRLSPEKGFDVLIHAVAGLLREGHDVELRIAGEGEEKSALQDLIARNGCAERIHLIGFQPDPRVFFQALDVFALSSSREGLPNVLLEAMALETPVVATRIAGIPRLIQDGRNGLLVEPGNASELAAALGHVLQEKELGGRLRQEGRRTIEADYSFRARMEKVRAVYDGLRDSRKRCSAGDRGAVGSFRS